MPAHLHFFAIIDPKVICFDFTPPTTFPLTSLTGPLSFCRDFGVSTSVDLLLGLSMTILVPGEQYPRPLERLQPSHTNSPKNPFLKSARIIESSGAGDEDGLE